MGAGTKKRILDAAERLFADRGYASTSLRTITKAAGVNLAAVHYHYHSKDVLLDQVIDRRASEVNRMRLEMLDRFRREARGRPVTLEKIMKRSWRRRSTCCARTPRSGSASRVSWDDCTPKATCRIRSCAAASGRSSRSSTTHCRSRCRSYRPEISPGARTS